MGALDNFLTDKLNRRKQEGLYRKLTTHNGLIDFCSNDYLGLACSRELFDNIHQKMSGLPDKLNGATGSRLLSGNSILYEEVEELLARIFKSQSVLLFNSGYIANQAVLSSIPQRGDIIFYDELAHACIKDGARLSLATRHSFAHNDLEDLEQKIKRSKANKIFIAVESIYSMDGDECPLRDLVTLAEAYEAIIILDEAHSTGVLGVHGSGLSIDAGLSDKIQIRIYTFGKALGTHGACVAGTTDLTNYLINFARPFIYTTALPPHSLISIKNAFEFLEKHPELQSQLKLKIETFIKYASFPNRTDSRTAIQTVLIPGNQQVKAAALSLQQKGFDVRPIVSPTVPKGSERLRICLHSFNTDEEVKDLTKELQTHC
jgi:8-amino-7-oxononanoate synthase